MVIGLKPLRHFHRGDVATALLRSPRHGEVGVEIHRPAPPAVSLGDRAHERADIQHPVVVGEIVRGNEVEPRSLLQPPVPGAQLGAGLEQGVARDLPVPVALGGALQLAPGSEGREAEIVRNRHREENLPRETGVGSGPKTTAPGRPRRPGAWAAAPCGALRVCGGAALPALVARSWDSDPEPAPPRAPARWPPAPA